MGLFDRFKKQPEVVKPAKETKPRSPKVEKTAKELATERGEPWVDCVTIDLDPDNIGAGAFELDWNDIFVARLVKAGFMQKKTDTDSEIVDRWFQSICRNVLNENFEQWEANQPYDARPRRVDRNDLGNGRTEIS